jgi:hypothetical protein
MVGFPNLLKGIEELETNVAEWRVLRLKVDSKTHMVVA